MLVSSFVLAAFLAAASWVPFGMADMMEYHEGMPMTNCPFMFGEEAVCAMSAFEQISSWQAMVTAVPIATVVVILLALLILFGSVLHAYDPPGLHSRSEGILPWSLFPVPLFAILLRSVISPRAP